MAIRPLNIAAVAQLKLAVTLVGGRVHTPPVPSGTPMPYLVLSDYSEGPLGHYGGSGADDNGFNIRGVARVGALPGETIGMGPLLSLWEQVKAALQDVPLAVTGHGEVIGDIRYLTDYAEPSDSSVRQFVARYDALTVAQ